MEKSAKVYFTGKVPFSKINKFTTRIRMSNFKLGYNSDLIEADQFTKAFIPSWNPFSDEEDRLANLEIEDS